MKNNISKVYLRYRITIVEVKSNWLGDTLIDGLSIKSTKTTSYITIRRSFTFHPQGNDTYNYNAGVKLIKISITCHDWLDPSTFRIMFDLVNADNTVRHTRFDQ